ncbi:MAG TPA: response regulator [Tepidisphaeraceae bacterium]|jgi:DNA-binding NtrC family response regulator
MPALSPAASGNLHVLVVEDESRLRDLLLDVLPDMGYTPAAARSAEEAARIMESHPHDILLLDLQLPGMGGMDFFELVRDRWPQTQVIIVTGFGELSAATRAIHLDVVDFLAKPCHLGDLEQSLDRARQRITTRGRLPIPPSAYPAENESAQTLKQSERELILAALARNEGNRSATARELAISRRTLYYKLREYTRNGWFID